MARTVGDRLRAALSRLLGGDGGVRRQSAAGRQGQPTGRPSPAGQPSPGGGVAAPAGTRPYPGDYRGTPAMAWEPKPDGQPDPGEIVWTWVPFEENHSVGKDRPVLLVGHDGDWLLAVMLTSQDHDRDAAQERRAGREWVDIGTGAWDRKGRPSEVRVNRLIRIDPRTVRREGAVLARERFDVVAAAIRARPSR